jgi:hypothetical protein
VRLHETSTQGDAVSVPAAALPGHRAPAPVEHHADLGGRVELVCPMCRHGEEIVITVPAVHEHRITAWITRSVTYPQHEITELDHGDPAVADDKPSGVKCLRCRWAYTGPAPLDRLVPNE